MTLTGVFSLARDLISQPNVGTPSAARAIVGEPMGVGSCAPESLLGQGLLKMR